MWGRIEGGSSATGKRGIAAVIRRKFSSRGFRNWRTVEVEGCRKFRGVEGLGIGCGVSAEAGKWRANRVF